MKQALAGISEVPLGNITLLLKIILLNGTQLCYTIFHSDIQFQGNVYLANKLVFKFDSVESKTEFAVNETNIELTANEDFMLSNRSLVVFAYQGGFDGARCVLYRARHLRTVHLFEGRVDTSSPTYDNVSLLVKADTVILDRPQPDVTIIPLCVHLLYDAGCKANKADFSHATTVKIGSNLMRLVSSLSQAAGYFQYGTVTFTSGANNGLTRTVTAFKQGEFSLDYPLLYMPAVGDGFVACAGCDRTKNTCQTRFANSDNRLSLDFVPYPEQSI